MALLEEDLAPLTATEPVVAWRAWTLTGRSNGSHLQLRPVGSRSHPWPALRPARAICRRGGRFHYAPDLDCTCGLHGTHGWDILRRTRSPAVLGTVAMWGRVVEHELGYRGEYAYRSASGSVCVLCFGSGAFTGVRPTWTLVRLGPADPLATSTSPQRSATASAPGASPVPRTIQRALLDTYGVDLLAV